MEYLVVLSWTSSGDRILVDGQFQVMATIDLTAFGRRFNPVLIIHQI